MSTQISEDLAINLTCPACFSKPGEKCTQPTSTGHRNLNTLHYARTALMDLPAMTDKRWEFLTSIIEEGVNGSAPWADVIATVRAGNDRIVAMEIVEVETGERHYITPAHIIEGFRRISFGLTRYSNSGYVDSPFGDTQSRFILFDRTNGEDSDLDALDFDAIIQAGIFNGELVYG
ncbi:hypothetical protein L3Y19_gp006 [Gordonia phage Neville]|uniref:Uncharacterized protein n=2 Tax=Nevillevirus TaxID=3044773 RepID=A0A515MGT6_9CAUD|nr:hypothetical protein L3Y19_gp006 [Gordonia phage Neville]YP_010245991.1 hypothetical protein L3Y20_gp006 [Gordonia phage Trax]AXQ64379.1 hypothetical protein SEA_NEVILLE_6 [Gordonia phage Neville]QDM55893.1 hypothetical protein SEA_TRAX_6 [Gordonia phage Trax]